LRRRWAVVNSDNHTAWNPGAAAPTVVCMAAKVSLQELGLHQQAFVEPDGGAHGVTVPVRHVGATFTLLAWAFAYVYVVCQALQPGSFASAAGSGNPRTWMELLFLSFTILSGVGLGDIVPLMPMARALVMIEEFSGVMYLALVVSRLIALSVTTRAAR